MPDIPTPMPFKDRAGSCLADLAVKPAREGPSPYNLAAAPSRNCRCSGAPPDGSKRSEVERTDDCAARECALMGFHRRPLCGGRLLRCTTARMADSTNVGGYTEVKVALRLICL